MSLYSDVAYCVGRLMQQFVASVDSQLWSPKGDQYQFFSGKNQYIIMRNCYENY